MNARNTKRYKHYKKQPMECEAQLAGTHNTKRYKHYKKQPMECDAQLAGTHIGRGNVLEICSGDVREMSEGANVPSRGTSE